MSQESNNQGNFLELLKHTADYNDDIKCVVLSNAPDNLKLTSPKVEKVVINAFAIKTTNIILNDLGGSFFFVLIDEARDISIKEQIVVVVCYVDKLGFVVERFLGIVHVSGTSAISLKVAIEAQFSKRGLSIVHVSGTSAISLNVAIEAQFSKHGLSMANLRGQCYDGASNMKGQFNGLKSLITRRRFMLIMCVELMLLSDQLDIYIDDMRLRKDFGEVNGISGLAKKIVESEKNGVYPLVYLLITLTLTLPVATATVERAFSAMRIIKGRLRNRMGDE